MMLCFLRVMLILVLYATVSCPALAKEPVHSFGHLVGMVYDDKNSRLVLLGDGDSTAPQLDWSCIAAAFEIATSDDGGFLKFSGPAFSLDPLHQDDLEDPWQSAVYILPKSIHKTSLARACFDADWNLKQYCFGVKLTRRDNKSIPIPPDDAAPPVKQDQVVEVCSNGESHVLVQEPRQSTVEGFKDLLKMMVEAHDRGETIEPQHSRLWILCRELKLSSRPGAVLFEDIKMGVETRSIGTVDGRVVDLKTEDALARKFADDFSRLYGPLSRECPSLAQIPEIIKMIAGARQLTRQGIDFDPDAIAKMIAEEVIVVERVSRLTARQKAQSYRVGDDVYIPILGLTGGVDLAMPELADADLFKPSDLPQKVLDHLSLNPEPESVLVAEDRQYAVRWTNLPLSPRAHNSRRRTAVPARDPELEPQLVQQLQRPPSITAPPVPARVVPEAPPAESSVSPVNNRRDVAPVLSPPSPTVNTPSLRPFESSSIGHYSKNQDGDLVLTINGQAVKLPGIGQDLGRLFGGAPNATALNRSILDRLDRLFPDDTAGPVFLVFDRASEGEVVQTHRLLARDRRNLITTIGNNAERMRRNYESLPMVYGSGQRNVEVVLLRDTLSPQQVREMQLDSVRTSQAIGLTNSHTDFKNISAGKVGVFVAEGDKFAAETFLKAIETSNVPWIVLSCGGRDMRAAALRAVESGKTPFVWIPQQPIPPMVIPRILEAMDHVVTESPGLRPPELMRATIDRAIDKAKSEMDDYAVKQLQQLLDALELSRADSLDGDLT